MGRPHTICAVGFRETALNASQQELISLQDGGADVIYILDDSTGLNIGFTINEREFKEFAIDAFNQRQPRL